MSIILNIDTAIEQASICISNQGQLIDQTINPIQKKHSEWIQVAIQDILKHNGLQVKELNAVAISQGPGSYTGLRIGMATAKGLCFVLGIPLLAINTLKIMAFAALGHSTDLLAPMIDARRMEVFTAVFDQNLEMLLPTQAMILNEKSYYKLLETNRILFFGNGSLKFQDQMNNPNAIFKDIIVSAEHMCSISYNMLKNNHISNLAYSEPLYCKDFYSTLKQSS